MADLHVRPLPLEEIVRHVRENSGLALARFSDGGFYCMQGIKGVNCDGVVYTAAQANALIAAIRNPKVTHCITSIALHRAYAALWLLKYSGLDWVEWYDGDVMHKASEEGKLWPLIEVLRTKRIVMVGPAHLRRLLAFPLEHFIECHPTQAFEQVDALERKLFALLLGSEIDTVLISAGQGAAPTLVSRLAGSGRTVLDMGSLWDMYVGVLSRSGPKRMGRKVIEELGRQNFHQEIGSWWPT